MALNIVVGDIAVPGSTGNFDLTLPSNTDPKAIILTAVPAAADGVVAHASKSVGFGTYRGSTVQQVFSSLFCEDNQATSDTYRRGTTTALAVLMDGTGAIDLEIRLDSMTTGSGSKVTLNAVNLHTTASVRLFYTVFGGSDVEDAQAHTGTPTNGSGAFDVALSSGFGHPTVVFMSTTLQPDDANSHGDVNLSFGWGVTGGATRGSGFSSLDASATEASSQRIDNARIQGFNGTTVEMDWVIAAESGYPTDGYEITKTTWSFFGDVYHGLALRLSTNVTVAAGEGAARTTTGTTNLTVGTSTPKGLILAHTRQATAASLDSTSADAALLGIGMVDGSGNERWVGAWDDDAQATASVASSAACDDKALRWYDPSTDTLDAEADCTVSGSDFVLNFGDAAPTAFLYEWIAFGEVGGGSQNISPGHVASGAALFAPTFAPGSVTVTPGTISAGSQVFAPALVHVLAPGHVASTGQVFAPSLAPGSVTVQPGHVASTEQVFAPTVGGSITVLPGHVASTEQVFAPILAVGSVTITPGRVESTEQVFAPALVGGDYVAPKGQRPTLGVG